MNTQDLNKDSVIQGKTKKYYPVGVAYIDSIIEESLYNVILVSGFLGLMRARFYDKVAFYEILTPQIFNELHKSHFVFILNSSIIDSENTINDIKESEFFKM